MFYYTFVSRISEKETDEFRRLEEEIRGREMPFKAASAKSKSEKEDKPKDKKSGGKGSSSGAKPNSPEDIGEYLEAMIVSIEGKRREEEEEEWNAKKPRISPDEILDAMRKRYEYLSNKFHALKCHLPDRVKNYNSESDIKSEGFFYPISIGDDEGNSYKFGYIAPEKVNTDKAIKKFLNRIGLDTAYSKLNEIDFDSVEEGVEDFAREGGGSSSRIFCKFKIESLTCGSFFVDCFAHSRTRAENRRKCRQLACGDSLSEELDRIYAGKPSGGITGNPVHYAVWYNDDESRDKACDVLISSLYGAGRINKKRYSVVDFDEDVGRYRDGLEAIFTSAMGGAVVLNIPLPGDSGCECSYGNYCLDGICSLIKKYKNDVLVVFCFPRNYKDADDNFFRRLPFMTFVNIQDKRFDYNRSVEYLEDKAGTAGIKDTSKLTGVLKADETYVPKELNLMFDEWLAEHLKTVEYPQYKDVSHVKAKEVIAPIEKGALDEINEMIGVTEAKKTLARLIDYYKAQRIFVEKGIVSEKPTLHFVFTGAPGSAKTTMARLLGKALRENRLLTSDTFVEAGRADLVGEYVGQTAPKVKDVFDKARGGVLFIDEAYSLADDKYYGTEAINTIVQECENQRDTCVIFAGYPELMKRFINSNPGLSSRINFKIDFPDYSPEELVEIARYMAKKQKMTLTDGACEKLLKIFTVASRKEGFGNGRYVRNALDEAKMALSSRLVRMNPGEITKETVSTITEEDIVAPVYEGLPSEGRRIGFSA